MINLKTGDLKPTLTGQFKDNDGDAIDLAGATVEFFMWDREDNKIIDGNAVNIVNASEGKVEYKWNDGETDEKGVYKAEFVATYSDGEMTIPNNGFISISIDEDLQ